MTTESRPSLQGALMGWSSRVVLSWGTGARPSGVLIDLSVDEDALGRNMTLGGAVPRAR